MDSLQAYSSTLANLKAPDEWYGHVSVSDRTTEGLYLTGEQCSAAFGSELVHKVMATPPVMPRHNIHSSLSINYVNPVYNTTYVWKCCMELPGDTMQYTV
jgi:hypothetical protein